MNHPTGDKWTDLEKTMSDSPGLLVSQEPVRELIAQVRSERSSKDTAYSERDQLVCALSKLFPAHIERHPDSDLTWEDDWRWIVFIQFPAGQGSWHIHDSELDWFDHLTRTEGNTWDGHSTTEKYARIARLEIIHHLPSISRGRP